MYKNLYSPTESFVVTDEYIYCLCYDRYLRKYVERHGHVLRLPRYWESNV